MASVDAGSACEVLFRCDQTMNLAVTDTQITDRHIAGRQITDRHITRRLPTTDYRQTDYWQNTDRQITDGQDYRQTDTDRQICRTQKHGWHGH